MSEGGWQASNWAARRGVETFDCNAGLLLARTSVEHLASVVGRRAARWDRNVLGSSIVLDRDFGWVFRLVGHPWSIFLYDDYESLGTPAELSIELDAPVIGYCCSDTTGSGGYVFASAGQIRESFSLTDDEVSFFSVDEARSEPDSYFEAVEQFFRDQDAYEPGIYPEYFFSDGRSVAQLTPGMKVTVGNPGFVTNAAGQVFTSKPEFERVDYVAFGP